MAKQQTLVNAQTDQDVNELINSVENKVRRADCKAVVKMMSEITGEDPKIWGKSIIGFGKYKYQRKNGDEFEWFHVGCSPAKAHMSIYLMYDLQNESESLEKLGPNNIGRGCLYIKKLEQVNVDVLKEMIAKSDRWSRDQ